MGGHLLIIPLLLNIHNLIIALFYFHFIYSMELKKELQIKVECQNLVNYIGKWWSSKTRFTLYSFSWIFFYSIPIWLAVSIMPLFIGLDTEKYNAIYIAFNIVLSFLGQIGLFLIWYFVLYKKYKKEKNNKKYFIQNEKLEFFYLEIDNKFLTKINGILTSKISKLQTKSKEAKNPSDAIEFKFKALEMGIYFFLNYDIYNYDVKLNGHFVLKQKLIEDFIKHLNFLFS